MGKKWSMFYQGQVQESYYIVEMCEAPIHVQYIYYSLLSEGYVMFN